MNYHNQSSKVRISYMNIRSLRNKINEIEVFLSKNQFPDIMALTESWLYPEEEKFVQMDSYSAFMQSRPNKRGGGVAVFKQNRFEGHLLTKETNLDCESVTIEINSKPKIKVQTIYRPPSTNIREFMHYLEESLQRYKNTIIIGDFNINLLSNNPETQMYKNLIRLNGYKIMNKINTQNATRIDNNGAKTIIDHVLSNVRTSVVKINLFDNPLSDHKGIEIEIEKIQPVKPKMEKRLFIHVDLKLLSTLVRKSIESTDINSIEKLTKCINESKLLASTTKSYRIRGGNTWITETIINKMKQKYDSYKKMKKSPYSAALRAEFYNLKKELTYLIRRSKRSHINTCLLKAGSDPRKMWKTINSNIQKKSTKSVINEIEVNGQSLYSTEEIAEHLNVYFASVGSSLAAALTEKYEIPKSNPNKLIGTQFLLTATNETEIKSIVKHLNKNTAPGPDEITVPEYITLLDIIAPNLERIFNEIIASGLYPTELKSSIVIPIHKAGTRLDPTNYRPISLINIASKILEKIIKEQLYSYMEEIEIMDRNQFGFQKHSNTEAALLEYTDYVYREMDQNKYALTIFLDIKKAFDTVDLDILLETLKDMGVRGKEASLLESYSKNRTQRTRIGNVLSSGTEVLNGVPQGSVLGPLLYLIYIQNFATLSKYVVFADDTTITFTGENKEKLEEDIKHDIEKLEIWLL